MQRMNRHLPLALASLIAGLVCAPATWAARPLVSETADSLAPHDCEWETAVASARTRGAPTVRVFDTLVACGVGGSTQLSGGFARASAAGTAAQSITLTGKTTLVEPKDGRTGWGLAYGASFDKLPGTGWRHGGTRLLGAATRALGENLTGHANLGWSRDEADKASTTTWSLGLEGNGALRWTADVFGDDRGKPWLSAGVLWSLTEKFNLNLAVAQGGESPRTRLWTLAFKLDF
jgi:hypothetical protein